MGGYQPAPPATADPHADSPNPPGLPMICENCDLLDVMIVRL